MRKTLTLAAGLALACGFAAAGFGAKETPVEQRDWDAPILTAAKLAAPAFAPVAEDPRLPRVLIIGDSISIGYTRVVQAELRGRANVLRIPDNGGPTPHGIHFLDAWLGAGPWAVIHFNFGIWDLYRRSVAPGEAESAARPITDLESYSANLRKIAVRLKQTGAVLIFGTSTPIPMGLKRFRFADEQIYNRAAEKVMQEEGVRIDDLRAAVAPQAARLQLPANVHFSEDGYRLLGLAVAGSIAACLPVSPSPPRALSWVSPALGEAIAGTFYPAARRGAAPGVVFLEELPGAAGNGRESRREIEALNGAGYAVATLNYSGRAKARSPGLNCDFLALRAQLPALVGGGAVDSDRLFIAPAGYRLLADVAYYESEGHRFAMDILLPPAAAVAPVPCVLQFAHNNAERMAANNFVRYHDTLLDGLATRGFAVAMADHPMPPPYVSTYVMPEVIYKVRAAVRTLRARARRGGLVPAGVGVIGFSRGGAMAAFAAAAGTEQIPDVSRAADSQEESVQGALCASGRYDLLALADSPQSASLAAAWGSPREHIVQWREASPIAYVSARTCPIFLAVGEGDQPFRVDQARRMDAALAAAGVPHALVIEPGIGHELPSDGQTLGAIDNFFLLHLASPPKSNLGLSP